MPSPLKTMQLIQLGSENIVAKTADYTVLGSDMGTFFTTRGAGASVTFTLPSASTVVPGSWCKFFNASATDVPMGVTANAMVVCNNAAATLVTYETPAEKIGGTFVCVSDGTAWLTWAILGNTLQTVTIT
jgi:hypothetical protein